MIPKYQKLVNEKFASLISKYFLNLSIIQHYSSSWCINITHAQLSDQIMIHSIIMSFGEGVSSLSVRCHMD